MSQKPKTNKPDLRQGIKRERSSSMQAGPQALVQGQVKNLRSERPRTRHQAENKSFLKGVSALDKATEKKTPIRSLKCAVPKCNQPRLQVRNAAGKIHYCAKHHEQHKASGDQPRLKVKIPVRSKRAPKTKHTATSSVGSPVAQPKPSPRAQAASSILSLSNALARAAARKKSGKNKRRSTRDRNRPARLQDDEQFRNEGPMSPSAREMSSLLLEFRRQSNEHGPPPEITLGASEDELPSSSPESSPITSPIFNSTRSKPLSGLMPKRFSFDYKIRKDRSNDVGKALSQLRISAANGKSMGANVPLAAAASTPAIPIASTPMKSHTITTPIQVHQPHISNGDAPTKAVALRVALRPFQSDGSPARSGAVPAKIPASATPVKVRPGAGRQQPYPAVVVPASQVTLASIVEDAPAEDSGHLFQSSKELPEGWAVQHNQSSNGRTRTKVYISPGGKRFRSLSKARSYHLQQADDKTHRAFSQDFQFLLDKLRKHLENEESLVNVNSKPVPKVAASERTLVFTHISCLEHSTTEGHLESASRLLEVLKALSRDGFQHVEWKSPMIPISSEDLTAVHSESYIQGFFTLCDLVESQVFKYLVMDAPYNDTLVTPGTRNAVLFGAASVTSAVDAVLHKQARNCFCAIRPPGHHAGVSNPMGSCIVNNVCVGVQYAKKVYGLNKIAVIDFDAHHGNGTQEIIVQDSSCFYTSIHRQAVFPFTGMNTFDVPQNAFIAPVVDRAGFLHAIPTLMQRVRKFAPQLIFISAGFDGHYSDCPEHTLQLLEMDFAHITQEIMSVADDVCEGRVISVLEGGYNIDSLAQCCADHVYALAASGK